MSVDNYTYHSTLWVTLPSGWFYIPLREITFNNSRAAPIFFTVTQFRMYESICVEKSTISFSDAFLSVLKTKCTQNIMRCFL